MARLLSGMRFFLADSILGAIRSELGVEPNKAGGGDKKGGASTAAAAATSLTLIDPFLRKLGRPRALSTSVSIARGHGYVHVRARC